MCTSIQDIPGKKGFPTFKVCSEKEKILAERFMVCYKVILFIMFVSFLGILAFCPLYSHGEDDGVFLSCW